MFGKKKKIKETIIEEIQTEPPIIEKIQTNIILEEKEKEEQKNFNEYMDKVVSDFMALTDEQKKIVIKVLHNKNNPKE